MSIVLFNKLHKKYLSFLFEIRNKPYVRKNSTNLKKTYFKKHVSWVSNFIKKPSNKIYIIKKNKFNAGYIRIETRGKIKKLSWALLKKYQKKGLMTKNLSYLTSNKNFSYRALIKKNNISSINMAINIGFKQIYIRGNFLYFKKY